MMTKKAQGLPMNVIIIAALAIVVLVVIIVIFTGRVQLFGRGLGACDGQCAANRAQCPADYAAIPTKNCDDNGDGTPEIKGAGFCCKATT